MRRNKLKWPQIVALIAPQALQFIAKDFLLAFQRGSRHDEDIIRITLQVGSGIPLTVGRIANSTSRIVPPNV